MKNRILRMLITCPIHLSHRLIRLFIMHRLEKARVRGAHALKRERMRQHYNNMMSELDTLEKADRKHR